MSELYGPFNSGTGAAFDETDWREMLGNFFSAGVIKGAKVSGSAGADLVPTVVGTGLQVRLGTGVAAAYGFFYENTANLTKTLGAADASLNRIDRMVVELDFVARTVLCTILVGTLASSPVAPTLTQTASKWDIPIAQFLVSHGVSTLVTGNMTDERAYCGLVPSNLAVGTTINGQTVFTTANDGSGSGLDADLLDGVNGSSYMRIGSNGQKIYVGPTQPGDVTKWQIWLKTPFS